MQSLRLHVRPSLRKPIFLEVHAETSHTEWCTGLLQNYARGNPDGSSGDSSEVQDSLIQTGGMATQLHPFSDASVQRVSGQFAKSGSPPSRNSILKATKPISSSGPTTPSTHLVASAAPVSLSDTSAPKKISGNSSSPLQIQPSESKGQERSRV